MKYCKNFWGLKVKTRDVYLWSNRQSTLVPHSPWVSFLGYMIHYNGEIKIRKSSIEKQILKHDNEFIKIAKKLDEIPDVNLVNQEYGILRSFETKLISMAVGKVNILNYRNEKLKMCWGAGFCLIENNKFIRSQLKKLDHSRKLNLSKLKFYFKERKIQNIKGEDNPEEYLKNKYPHSFYSLLERPK